MGIITHIQKGVWVCEVKCCSGTGRHARQVPVVTWGVHAKSATSVAGTSPPQRTPFLTGAVLQTERHPFAALQPAGRCLRSLLCLTPSPGWPLHHLQKGNQASLHNLSTTRERDRASSYLEPFSPSQVITGVQFEKLGARFNDSKLAA